MKKKREREGGGGGTVEWVDGEREEEERDGKGCE